LSRNSILHPSVHAAAGMHSHQLLQPLIARLQECSVNSSNVQRQSQQLNDQPLHHSLCPSSRAELFVEEALARLQDLPRLGGNLCDAASAAQHCGRRALT
jgi:hypothetical protein